jgi:hypothetical protein
LTSTPPTHRPSLKPPQLDGSNNLAVSSTICFTLLDRERSGSTGNEPGFFELDDRLRRLGDLGDQFEAFGRAVDFGI